MDFSAVQPIRTMIGPGPRRSGGLGRALLLALVLALSGAGCVSGSGDDETSDGGQTVEVDTTAVPTRGELKPIVTLGVPDWTAAALNAAIAEEIIERRLGYPVETAPVVDSQRMLRDVASGDIDAVLELWPSSFDDENWEMVTSGQVEDLGPLGVEGKIGWFVPRYVLDRHPDLTDWEPLASADVAADFATAETGRRGRFLGTDSNWEQFDQDIIDQLNLPFDVVFTGSEEATRAELTRAASGEDPVLLFWWTPTAEVTAFDLVNVPLPTRTDECEAEMEAGGPQSCDYPRDQLFKIASPELATEAAEVHRFLARFTLTTDDQLQMIHQVETEGRSVADVAAEWVAEHESRWAPWLS